MAKVKWATARVVFLMAVLAATATGNVLAYLLGPIYSWYFFNDINFLKYNRYFYPLTICGWRLLAEWIRNPDYRNMFAIPLTAPPMIAPDQSLVRVRDTWHEINGACEGCERCCTRRSCPLLDVERKRCKSYGSFFWRYFNCGRYPENIAQVQFYDCPKWETEKG